MQACVWWGEGVGGQHVPVNDALLLLGWHFLSAHIYEQSSNLIRILEIKSSKLRKNGI